MSNVINVSYTDFIQKTMMLDGQRWSFANRPYIYPIINNNATRTLMLAARQVEKSTTMAGRHLAKGCLNANRSYLYVSPTMKQTGVFSRKKVDEVFETSPLIKQNFYPGVKGFRVEEKRLKNHTTLYYRSAFHDADGIRGITSAGTDFDEIQDMLPEVMPVIEACSQKQLDAQFLYSGTPKTYDNNIHLMWERSSQNEWGIKCLHCGKWNILSIDNVLLDKPGLWCVKCQKDIYSPKGCWVKGREEEMLGFRLPYIILHPSYINWKDLFWKMRNHGIAELMNETFGMSYDSGSKPLTREQLIESCNPIRKIWYDIPAEYRGYRFYAGLDWGSGTKGYTILTIGYFNTIIDKFCIVYSKRYIGREAEPENLIPELARVILHYQVSVVGADKGFGWGSNDRLKHLLPSHVAYSTYAHSYIKKFVAWNEDAGNYVTNRTEVMTELFNRIKMGKMEFYNWPEFEDIGKDYLNINSEYSETLRQLRYIHTQPDDSFHSTLYALISWMIVTKQKPVTRLEPGDLEMDEVTQK